MAIRNHDYNVNFFRPTSEHARGDMRLIVGLAVVWATAVFGFQFLLIGTEEKRPEPNHGVFESVWPAVSNGTATASDHQQMARVMLGILGKNVALRAPTEAQINAGTSDKQIFESALTNSVLTLLPAEARGRQADGNPMSRDEIVTQAATAIGLGSDGFDPLLAALLPSSLPAGFESTKRGLSSEVKVQLPPLVDLYLIHNQSALTDFRFFGFPFHYWYTAQFLLILFVGLCLLYAVFIEKIHAKHGFVEE